MDFVKFAEFVYLHYGINLSAYKSKQLFRRVESFIARAGARDESEFIEMLKRDSVLSKKFIDHLTINVSEFFRNKDMFLDLELKIKEYLNPEKKALKIWSAGCSNGSEPYSLAIIMDRLSPSRNHNIIATDIDQTIIETAKRGIYSKNDIKNVDNDLVEKYFYMQEDKYNIKESIKNKIKFKRHDLIVEKYDGNMDLILCRNVVIYFTQEAKNEIYRKFYQSLNPGGLLFVGATESIYNYREIGFEKASTFIYRKPGGC